MVPSLPWIIGARNGTKATTNRFPRPPKSRLSMALMFWLIAGFQGAKNSLGRNHLLHHHHHHFNVIKTTTMSQFHKTQGHHMEAHTSVPNAFHQ
jgi:hypothetical protein